MAKPEASNHNRKERTSVFDKRPDYEQFGAFLRKVRIKKGGKQKPLSQAIGKPDQFLNKVEAGVQRIDCVDLLDLLKALDMSFVEFASEYELNGP